MSIWTVILCAWLLSGCLYSTQHFHTGVLLPAGKSQTTLGAGRQPLWRCANYQSDSLGTRRVCDEDGTGSEKIEKSDVFKGSLDYRLGVRDSWGPFPGVELQWHLEIPTSPATMEFAMNLALPSNGAYRHKLGAGWGIGAWADNSYFLDYAISRKLGRPLFFGSFRTTWLATQIGDVIGEDFAKPFPSHQHLILQGAFGAQLQLPDWAVAPDFFVPLINLTWPQVPSGDQKFKPKSIPLMQWDMSFGLGWTF